MVSLAHRAGYQSTGLRLLPSMPGSQVFPLIDDAALLRDTLSRISDTGTGVYELEVIRIGANFKSSDHMKFLETGAKLGAKAVVVVGDHGDEPRLADSFAALCEDAQPFGLSINLEFVPFLGIKTAAAANRVVQKANASNGAVLVDPLHFSRSHSLLADVAAIPPRMSIFAQICDAPAEVPTTMEELLHTARDERLLPGEGGIDLASIFSLLPAGLPISIEIPNPRAKTMGQEAWVKECLVASKRCMAAVDAARVHK
jgi:sugar phosphate isomerase/epimerase